MNLKSIFCPIESVACAVLVLALSGWSSMARGAEEIKLSATAQGVEVDGGLMGKFLIQPPYLSMEADQKLTGTWTVTGEDEGEVLYPNGAKFKCKVKRTEIDWSFRDLPKKGTPKVMFMMAIPLSYNEGGKYKFDKKLTEFPPRIETEQFIVNGISSDFSFTNKDGVGLTIEVKTNWYGLQDDRVWNSNEYSYQFLIDLTAAGGNGFSIKVKPFKP